MTHKSKSGSTMKSGTKSTKELDPKLIEQAWSQHVNSRQAFSRDLTIGLVAVLLLTVTFFRSVSDFEAYSLVETRLQKNYVREAAHRNNVVNRLMLFPLTYFAGQDQIAEIVRHVPCAADERTSAIRSEALESGPWAIDMSRIAPLTACSESIGAAYSPDLSSRLPVREWSELVDAVVMTNKIPDKLFAQEVMLPLDEALRHQKDVLLDQPITDAVTDLKGAITVQQQALTDVESGDLSAPLRQSRKVLDQLAAGINDAPLALLPQQSAGRPGTALLGEAELAVDPLLFDIYFASLQGQMESIDDYLLIAQQLDLTDAFGHVEQVMTAARSAEPETAELLARREQLEDDVVLVNPVYTGPLPGSVSLRPAEIVRVFPLALAMTLAFFIWRFTQLRQRTADLKGAFLKQRYAEPDVNLILPELGSAGAARSRSGTHQIVVVFGDVLGIAFVLLTGAAVVYTSYASLMMRDNSGDNRWLLFMYVIAVALVVSAFVALAVEFLGDDAATPDSTPTFTVLGSLRSIRRDFRLWKSDHRSQLAGLSEARKPAVVAVVALILIATVEVTGVASALGKRGNVLLEDQHWVEGSLEMINPEKPPESIILGKFLAFQEAPSGERIRASGPLDSLPSTPSDKWNVGQLNDPDLNATAGKQVVLHVTTAGYEGEPLRLRWSLTRVSDDASRSDPFFTDQPAFPSSVLIPRSNSSVNDIKVWIPDAPLPGQYELTFSLTQDNGAPIDNLTTWFEEPAPTLAG